MLISAAILAVLLAGSAPRPPAPGEVETGDAALAAQARDLLDPPTGHLGLAVARVDDAGVRTAGLGSGGDGEPLTGDTPLEIGSIAKAMTGMLLTDAIERGVVDEETTVGEAMGADAPGRVADLRLTALARHRAGLPRLSGGLSRLAWAAAGSLFGVNPYAAGTGGREGLLDEVADVSIDDEPAFAYSNLGAALLGHALAAAHDTSYAALLEERLTAPLGMADTRVVAPSEPLPEPRADGHRANGRPVDPWRDLGYAPAGTGIWSSAADLGRLADAVMDGSAPGAEAVRPRADADGDHRVGHGWLIDEGAGRRIAWHDGGTGGYRSYIAIDLEQERAAVAIGNTDAEVGAVARGLVDAPAGDDGDWWTAPTAWLPLGVLALAAVSAGRILRRGASGDRADRLEAVTEPAALVALAGALGPWHRVSVLVWGAAALLVVLAAGKVATTWEQGTRWRRRSAVGWAGKSLSVAVGVAMLVVLPVLPLLR